MFQRHDSSSFEDEEDDNFGHYKKVPDHNIAFDSDNNDSIGDDSQSVEVEESRRSRRPNNTKLRRKNTSNNENEEKSKAIKKNRQSAKISRLRKKQYQEVLEQKVAELENQITTRKQNITNISQSILNKFQNTNQDVPQVASQKYTYLVQKMSVSNKLLSISNSLNKLRTTQEELRNGHDNHQDAKVEESSMLKEDYSAMKGPGEGRTKSTKGKKKKGEMAVEEELSKLSETIKEKQELLEMSIKSYMYEFGVKGCLRSDIIQRCKQQWLQTIQSTAQPNSQIIQGIHRMKERLQKLDRQSKLLDFHMRQLKDRVKDKYVVQFLLDREFFINNSEDTIYKNSQLKSSNN